MSRLFYRSFLSHWFSASQRSATASRPAFRRVRLAVEVLEDRSMPSVVTVTSTSDNPSDTGSLRYALNNATPGEVIDFAANVRTIDLSNTLNAAGLTIGVNLSITNDQGVGPVTIDGGGHFTDFTVIGAAVTASLSGLTIAGGTGGGGGGGIAIYSGTVTVSNTTISNNSASPGPSGNDVGGGGILNYGTLRVSNGIFSDNSAHGNLAAGGGIFNAGTLSVSNSTFSNNTADGSGGGISNSATLTVNSSTFANNSTNGSGGGIFNLGGGGFALAMLTINNSTFSSNAAGGSGGGISNYGTLTVSNSTFSANLVFSGAPQGGGINTNSYPALVTLNGDIVSGNVNTFAGTKPDDIVGLVDLSSSDNLIGTGGSGGLIDGENGNQVGVSIANVGLGALNSNGGPTQTFAIGPGSFAIGKGFTETTASTDQRGVARPINQPSDVGAFQYSAAPTVTTNPTSQTIIAGQNASFSAAASDGNPTPTTVQWQFSTDDGNSFTNLSNDIVYSGVASTTLTITSAPVTLAGDRYRAVFSNAAGLDATTTDAKLTVDLAPTVTANPTAATVSAGQNVSFTAAATDGNPTPTSVQWEVSSDGGSTFQTLDAGGIYGGVNTDTLTITGATAALNHYEYLAVFSNAADLGAATTAATLTVTPATPPGFSYDPTTQVLTITGTATQNSFTFSQASTEEVSRTVHTTYSFTLNGNSASYPDTALAKVVVSAQGTENTAILITDDA
jgi:hypothetical protein